MLSSLYQPFMLFVNLLASCFDALRPIANREYSKPSLPSVKKPASSICCLLLCTKRKPTAHRCKTALKNEHEKISIWHQALSVYYICAVVSFRAVSHHYSLTNKLMLIPFEVQLPIAEFQGLAAAFCVRSTIISLCIVHYSGN